MFNFLKQEQLLRQILGIQKDFYLNETGKSFVMQDSYINKFSQNENSVKVIVDHINLKILHISDTVDRLSGHSIKDFDDFNVLFALKLFTLEHHNFIHVWVKWAFSIFEKKGSACNIRHVLCGVKLNHKKGHTMRLLFRQYPLEETATGLPVISVISIDDISHLMKEDFYWGRVIFGDKIVETNHFFSKDGEDKPYDIITDREKEVLVLLAQGKESKEIGDELFISYHTVDHHRRNMLNKLGVKDTTDLVQICKMVGII
jgi:DNA-binding CsgD family transcriptional regulator